ETDHIDFLQFHGLTWDAYRGRLTNDNGPLAAALKAKEKGLIKHISYSTHDSPEGIRKLIDTGEFASMLLQYNLLDRVNEEVIAHAAESGMGVVVMGPVGGGRLSTSSSIIPGATDASATARLALRFVLSNPNVHVAISGMNSIQMVEENVETASNVEPMSAKEKKDLDALFEKNKELMDLPCTSCRYCLPCPEEVGIPEVFSAYNLEKVYGLTESARNAYAELGKGWHEKHKPAGVCVECGECEPKCPQNIAIRERLKEAHAALAVEK
ncbi:MAG: aldo/keto reductase, partial [Phycisphaerae bacterium]|nr:aldo/keto reductase [Phycisphaerae bacterium]